MSGIELCWDDARAIFSLVGELRELGRDVATWRTHMLEALARLVGAKVGIAAEARTPYVNDPGRFVGTLDVGWGTPAEREAWSGTCDLAGADRDPCDDRLDRVGDASFTVTRPAFVDDRAWYRASFVAERLRAAGIDDFILSHQVVPQLGVVHAILLYREWGESPFSDVDVVRVARFHAELGRLWETPDPMLALPPRLRQTLARLAAGDSEKQVADALDLQPSTVHDYVKALHRRLGVHSRGELLARVARPAPHPWLALALTESERPPASTGVIRVADRVA